MSPRRKILLIDDSADFCGMFEDLCLMLGFNLMTACSRQEVAQLASGHTFDVILFDAILPSWNGVEAGRELKRLFGPQMPVIVLHPNRSEGMSAAAALAGADDFLEKPIHFETLLNSIDRLCK